MFLCHLGDVSTRRDFVYVVLTEDHLLTVSVVLEYDSQVGQLDDWLVDSNGYLVAISKAVPFGLISESSKTTWFFCRCWRSGTPAEGSRICKSD